MTWALLLACAREPSFALQETGARPALTVLTDSAPGQGDSGGGSSHESAVDSSPGRTETGSLQDTGTEPTSGEQGWRFTAASCAQPRASGEPRYQRVEIPRSPPREWDVSGGGAIVADLDADGAFELIFPDEEGVRVFTLESGSPELVTARFLAVDPGLVQPTGGAAADVDGDGDLDVVLTDRRGPNRLFRNEEGRLVEVSGALSPVSWASLGAAFADFDGDEDLDLVVANYGDYPRGKLAAVPHDAELYRNRGDGSFEDASVLLPLEAHDGLNFLLAWQDLDGDQRPELLVLNDLPHVMPSALLKWSSGRFLVDRSAGFHPNFDSMGLGVGDLNGDGVPDLAETSFIRVGLLLSQPSADALIGSSYINWADVYGLEVDLRTRGQGFGWGIAIADLDNDGDEDIPLILGGWNVFAPHVPGSQPTPAADHLFLRNSAGVFFDVATEPEWSWADSQAGRGLVVADLNRDGWLDHLKRQLDGPDLLYLSRCGEEHWLTVSLEDHTSANRWGIGAEVEVIAVGGAVRRRWLASGGTSLFVGGPPEVHFGLASAAQVERLVVRWPDGSTTEGGPFPADQQVTVRRWER